MKIMFDKEQGRYLQNNKNSENKGRFPDKKMHIFGFCSHEGGGALPKCFGTFSRGAFLVTKGVYFFQNANNFNFKLFFRLYIYNKAYRVAEVVQGYGGPRRKVWTRTKFLSPSIHSFDPN